MADSPDLTELMRRAVQLNARLYKGWIDLSVDYMRGLAEIFGGDIPAAVDSATADAGVDMNTGAVVLEAEEGELARGAFLVTNDLGRSLSCVLISREFVSRSGARVQADMSFDPPKFELAPGQRQVVQVAVKMDGRLEAGVAYTGDFTIRGMEGYSVPAVLRRTHAPVTSPIEAVAAQEVERTTGAEQQMAGTSSAQASTSRSGKRGPRKKK